VLTDRLTARILGAVVLLMAVTIDIGCFMFTKPEIRQRPNFPLFVLVLSLPLVALAIYFFRRASQLKD
jgi:hypothetical protein